MRFVLIDRFVEAEPGRRAVALKTFDALDPLFLDHFPGAPLVPGVLLTEAIGQTAGWLLAASAPEGRWPLLAMIERAKFRRNVRPGEEIRLEAEVRECGADRARVHGSASVGGRAAADAALLFHFAPLGSLGAGSGGALAGWARGLTEEMGLAALLSRSGGPVRA